ncbi:hypothetical protein BJ122_102246 [Rhodopseudomonas faecalis]|uniref:Uncharacterized protein n=1 Tax=Rhodopseudomonas faecalis TaxID=99655 RepID=A0A318TMD3_9BRAD|nr:hypothetical protein [Rhodopseudomonas faecalis]PYF05020.1 hypothetical protein BJ122_102246 [Rhodopseudomonas faecalis]
MKREASFDLMGDRYQFDFKLCSPERGWAQIDTRQDAPYYGTWCNPTTREIVSYSEGDISRAWAENADDFKAELRRVVDWHRERGFFIGIDPITEPIRDALVELGFNGDLHEIWRKG